MISTQQTVRLALRHRTGHAAGTDALSFSLVAGRRDLTARSAGDYRACVRQSDQRAIFWSIARQNVRQVNPDAYNSVTFRRNITWASPINDDQKRFLCSNVEAFAGLRSPQ